MRKKRKGSWKKRMSNTELSIGIDPSNISFCIKGYICGCEAWISKSYMKVPPKSLNEEVNFIIDMLINKPILDVENV